MSLVSVAAFGSGNISRSHKKNLLPSVSKSLARGQDSLGVQDWRMKPQPRAHSCWPGDQSPSTLRFGCPIIKGAR